MAKILIKNGRVFDGERFLYADVLTDGERVAEIGTSIPEDGATFVYDAAGKTVTAGLVDAHVHMRGISCERYGVQAEMSTLPFGVTAAADAEGTFGDKALLDSFLLKSAVFVKAPIPGNRFDSSGIEAALLRYGDRAVGLKVYFDTGVSEVRDTEPLREVCAFAHARGLRVMVHSSHSPVPMAELLPALDKGDILTHAFHGGEHHAAEDGFESMKTAKARGVIIDAGLAGHVHTDFEVFGEAIRRGVLPDVISTDITKSSAYTRGGRYGLTMCMSIARTLGISETDVFRAVTTAPARALGKGDEWGTLSVGRHADLAVLEYTDEGFDLTDKAGNHIRSSEGYRCVLTLSDGQVVYRN